ncbi:MAG: MBL fold metallo-hydrolase, partial [Acetobacteraceae bacterium]|nr:MBL fold metallo-hydrolase [Acetobacteraceae bacterium]
AALPAVAGLARSAAAQAPAAPPAGPAPLVQVPGFYRFRLGALDCTVLSDGWTALDPHPTFGVNATAEEVAQALRAARRPTDAVPVDFNCLLVRSGQQVILFDTGSGPNRPFGPNTGKLLENMAAAGIAPEEVTLVAYTHAHPDHCWGTLKADNTPAFPNARYALSGADYDFWAAEATGRLPDPVGMMARGTRAVLRPLGQRTTMLAAQADVAPGIRALAARGHSPGHTIYRIESEGQALLVLGDTANHSVLSLARPDWHFGFDADPAAAVETRRRVLGMAASDGVLVLGFHFPWPGLGWVEAAGEGFRFLPAPWRWQ